GGERAVSDLASVQFRAAAQVRGVLPGELRLLGRQRKLAGLPVGPEPEPCLTLMRSPGSAGAGEPRLGAQSARCAGTRRRGPVPGPASVPAGGRDARASRGGSRPSGPQMPPGKNAAVRRRAALLMLAVIFLLVPFSPAGSWLLERAPDRFLRWEARCNSP